MESSACCAFIATWKKKQMKEACIQSTICTETFAIRMAMLYPTDLQFCSTICLLSKCPRQSGRDDTVHPKSDSDDFHLLRENINIVQKKAETI
jgi:hypothetical protein